MRGGSRNFPKGQDWGTVRSGENPPVGDLGDEVYSKSKGAQKLGFNGEEAGAAQVHCWESEVGDGTPHHLLNLPLTIQYRMT